METKKRSIAKAVTWRILAIFTLGTLAYFITGDIAEVGLLTLLFTIIQTVMYFVHERIWHRVKWGRLEHPLSDINLKDRLSTEEIEEIEEKLRDMGRM